MTNKIRIPDIKGPVAKVWKIPDPTIYKEKATLIMYLIESTRFHPVWNHWVISMIHLRDIEGVKPAHKLYSNAEYELMGISINPEECPNPDPSKPEEFRYLRPMDLSIQFNGLTDEQVKVMCTEMMNLVTTGHLSPDQDFEGHWMEIISQRTINCIRARDVQ